VHTFCYKMGQSRNKKSRAVLGSVTKGTELNSGAILMRSLAIGAAAGLAVFAMFYGFFISHRELDVQPSSARWLGLAVFFAGFVISWIYFQMRAKR